MPHGCANVLAVYIYPYAYTQFPLDFFPCFHRVFELGSSCMVVDDLSMTFLAGSTVDYKELIRSSFRIVGNPNTELGCSCGVSFALK